MDANPYESPRDVEPALAAAPQREEQVGCVTWVIALVAALIFGYLMLPTRE